MADDNLRKQVKRYSDVLNDRIPEINTLEDYREGKYPPPPLVNDSELTRAYRLLMELSGSNWPGLIVSAVEERIEVQGVRFGDEDADNEVWKIWQDNGLDAESSMLHDSVLTTGRGYAIVWGDGSNDPQPKVTYEHASTCVVEYIPGTRTRRGALRRWKDGNQWYANLFLPGKLHKFEAGEEIPNDANGWEPVDGGGEFDGIPDEVPVVEFSVNRSLRPSQFGTGYGEFATNLRHIDRINYKVFSGLVALTWSGFPLRYVIGDPILFEKGDDGKDDKSKPKPPFNSHAAAVAQFEKPDVTVGQLPEATIANYSPEMDIKHLAAMTKTPAYYLLGEMVNISADGIRAGEGGLISKVKRHHRTLGESHEEVSRLALKVKKPDDPRASDQSAQIIWSDPESRSLAERADAGLKMQQAGMPNSVIMSKVYGMTPQEINRANADRGVDLLTQVAEQMQSGNGNGGGKPTASGNVMKGVGSS